MLKTTITKLSIIAIIIGSVFIANGLILAWTSPSASPPGSNVSAPLNVGSTAQTKAGSLRSSSDIRAPIFYDQNNTGYYTNPASNSWLYRLYSYDIRADIFYDRNNTSYYVNPAGTSKLKTINLGGVSRSSWPGGAYQFGGAYTMKWRTGSYSRLVCYGRNPATGACSCPSGFTKIQVSYDTIRGWVCFK